jgi:translation initiation factor 3 subunit M
MVEVSDEDLILAVAKAMGLEKQCEKLAGEEKTSELLSTLASAAGDFVAKAASAGDAESGLSILAHNIAKLPTKQCEDLASKFVSSATSASTSKAKSATDELKDLTIAVLMRAYNAFPPKSAARFNTLISALKYAASAKRTGELAAALKGKVQLIKNEYALEGDSFRVFLLALSNLSAEPGTDSYSILTEYLASFSPPSAVTSDANAPEVAKRAVRDLVSTPGLVQCDFYDTVKHLGTKGGFGKVSELIKLVVESDLKKMKAFCGSNKAVLKEVGVTEEQCLDKVSLLVLASMGAQAQTTNGEISYADIRANLNIPEEEVEIWLIKAIGLKVLEGRMDQFNQHLKVQKTAYKSFGNPEWNTLKNKLGNIHNNVSNVQTKLKTRK